MCPYSVKKEINLIQHFVFKPESVHIQHNAGLLAKLAD